MKRAKSDAIISLSLGLLFYVFFQMSKQVQPIAQINSFAEDPYDAVGSAAVQLVLLLGLLSMLRAFRPCTKVASLSLEFLNGRLRLIATSRMLAALAIALTMLADSTAMIRHIDMLRPAWPSRFLMGGMVVLLALGTGEILRSWKVSKNSGIVLRPAYGLAAFLSVAAVVGILALYPEDFRQTLPGELITVAVGIAMLFLPVSIYLWGTMPNHTEFMPDLIDDIVAIYQAAKERISWIRPVTDASEHLLQYNLFLKFGAWINPRKHKRRPILLLGAAGGLSLVSAELFFEGVRNFNIALLLIAIFLGFETAIILLTFELISRPLRLFRNRNIDK